jgi:hypothetical protein
VALGQVLSDYFGFLCQFSFNRLLHKSSSSSSGAGTTGQTVAYVVNRHSLCPPQETNTFQILENTTFRKRDLLPSSGVGGYILSWVRLERANSNGQRTEQVSSSLTCGREQIQFPGHCRSLQEVFFQYSDQNFVILQRHAHQCISEVCSLSSPTTFFNRLLKQ